MTASLAELSWPLSRLGEALAAVARRSGLSPCERNIQAPPGELTAAGGDRDGTRLDRWIQAAAAGLGLEAEAVEAPYAEIPDLIARGSPAILRVEDPRHAGFIVLAGGSGGGRRDEGLALTPDLEARRVGLETVRAALCGEAEATVASEVERLLEAAGVAERRRDGARKALFSELLASRRIGNAWIIRTAGERDLANHAREARLPRLLSVLVAAFVIQFVLWIGSWWLLGRGALDGRLDRGWLLAWGLILASLIPFRLMSTYAAGIFSIRAGALLKRRLLFGSLKLDPDEVRHMGVGELLGRVIESEVVEQMAIAGGFLGVTAVIELALAAVVLGHGAGGWLSLLVLLGWVFAAGLFGLSYWRRRREWTQARLAMTNELVERMVGHRTRLAQEAREEWNVGEDQALERYFGISRSLDRGAARIQALIPRGWFMLGILSLAPAYVAGGSSAGLLAVGIGGVLLAFQAFRDLSDGLEKIIAAAIAWERIEPFWRAAARVEPLGLPEFSVRSPGGADGRALLLDARDLVFRYRHRAEPVLRGVNLRIHAGDRILLEGPSGGGKSTLGALLSASRVPDSGLLLFQGLDQETLGREDWRRHVVVAPQFHENHVLLGTFAFNALMGRGWPPREKDLAEAESVLRSLDLGPLLDRMPAGLLEMVGDTGWQLSHGEKSRLYIARALLEGADLYLLDESFAALDPETLEKTLRFVLDRAPTVLVIAHP